MKTPKKTASLMPAKNPIQAAFELMPKQAKPSLQSAPPKAPKAPAKSVKAPKAPKVAKAPAKPFKNPISKGKK